MRSARPADERDFAVLGRLDGTDRRLFQDRHAFLDQPRAHDLHKLRVVAPEQALRLEQRDLCAEPAVGLGHLHPDRAAAEHEQMTRFRRLIEQGLVGEVGNRVETRNLRDHGRRPGADDKAPRGNAGAAHLQEAGRDEVGLAVHHMGAEATESLRRIVRLDRGDRAAHVVVSGGEIVAPRRGGQQSLGGDAARVEALPAHARLLDQDHRRAHLDGAGGERQARRARADHAEIGPDPVGRGARPAYARRSHAPPWVCSQ